MPRSFCPWPSFWRELAVAWTLWEAAEARSSLGGRDRAAALAGLRTLEAERREALERSSPQRAERSACGRPWCDCWTSV